jgi:methylaspartate mutase epsilon subunit
MAETTKQISRDEFLRIRDEVLRTWPTGAAVTSFDDGVRRQSALPAHKRFAQAMSEARKAGKTLLQPRAGVALVEDHVQLLNHLARAGEADLLPTTVDAYTRQNRYTEAAAGIQRSEAAGASLLNGFPAVNHGLDGCRRVAEAVDKPVQVRHGTPDARLLAEITLSAGFSSFEGGGISYNIPYAKRVPLDKSIRDWQYVDRLVGLYGEAGVCINREPFGPLTGTLVPPCISHAIGIIEGLLALEQGVRSISLGYGQTGNLLQDVAALLSLRELADEYFRRDGHADAEVTTVFHQWMGGFPEDESKAFAVISWGAAAAVLAAADKVIVKTPHEAMGIPTREANVCGLRATRQIVNMLAGQRLEAGPALQRETDFIKAEARCLLDRTRELGNGNWAHGAAAAFESGVLDVPFAPSIYNRGRLLPIRDDEGFVRIYQPGNLPLTPDILAYHAARLAERARNERRSLGYQMVTDDIYAISKGRLVGRPR